MAAHVYHFKNLVDARTSLVGKAETIKIEAPKPFAAGNAPGDLHSVSSLNEVGAIAEASAKRLKSIVQK